MSIWQYFCCWYHGLDIPCKYKFIPRQYCLSINVVKSGLDPNNKSCIQRLSHWYTNQIWKIWVILQCRWYLQVGSLIPLLMIINTMSSSNIYHTDTSLHMSWDYLHVWNPFLVCLMLASTVSTLWYRNCSNHHNWASGSIPRRS